MSTVPVDEHLQIAKEVIQSYRLNGAWLCRSTDILIQEMRVRTGLGFTSAQMKIGEALHAMQPGE